MRYLLRLVDDGRLCDGHALYERHEHRASRLRSASNHSLGVLKASLEVLWFNMRRACCTIVDCILRLRDAILSVATEIFDQKRFWLLCVLSLARHLLDLNGDQASLLSA